MIFSIQAYAVFAFNLIFYPQLLFLTNFQVKITFHVVIITIFAFKISVSAIILNKFSSQNEIFISYFQLSLQFNYHLSCLILCLLKFSIFNPQKTDCSKQLILTCISYWLRAFFIINNHYFFSANCRCHQLFCLLYLHNFIEFKVAPVDATRRQSVRSLNYFSISNNVEIKCISLQFLLYTLV